MKNGTVWLALLLASAAIAGCSNDAPTAYETCEPGQCTGVDGCSSVRVEYPEGAAIAGICTDECAVDEDCPVDSRGAQGACATFIGSMVCFERCATDEDCPDGLGCVDRLSDSSGMTVFFDPICLPVLAR